MPGHSKRGREKAPERQFYPRTRSPDQVHQHQITEDVPSQKATHRSGRSKTESYPHSSKKKNHVAEERPGGSRQRSRLSQYEQSGDGVESRNTNRRARSRGKSTPKQPPEYCHGNASSYDGGDEDSVLGRIDHESSGQASEDQAMILRSQDQQVQRHEQHTFRQHELPVRTRTPPAPSPPPALASRTPSPQPRAAQKRPRNDRPRQARRRDQVS